MTQKIDKKGAVLQRTVRLSTNRSSKWLLYRIVTSHLYHPPYSLDLAPSDYFLKQLAWRHYQSGEEVIAVVEEFFKDKDDGFYTKGIK